jgi:hypothetical protein
VLNTNQQAGHATIRALNDELRHALPFPKPHGLLMMTRGLEPLTVAQVSALVVAIRDFNDFTPDNDPHGEHDFGAVEHDGVRYFWKIDAYDQSLEFASPDPADPAVTTRVLTIMRADEY